MEISTELTADMILEPDPDEQSPVVHEDSAPPVDRTFYRHWWMLWISLGVIAMAFLLQVRPDQRVAFRGLLDYPLPESCMTFRLTGTDCPGCGLTRSFVLLAEGNVAASFARHRVGWILALAVVTQVPYRLYMIRRGPNAPRGSKLKSRFTSLFSTTLIVLLIGNWIANLIW